MNERCKYHVCDEEDDHSPECTDWQQEAKPEKAQEPVALLWKAICDEAECVALPGANGGKRMLLTEEMCQRLGAAIENLAQPNAQQLKDEAKPLHPDTESLVQRFAAAMRDKLAKAERKYGHSNRWMTSDWMDECREQLLRHLYKGDPLDVANYCAFLWHHGEYCKSAYGEQVAVVDPRSFHGLRWLQMLRQLPVGTILYAHLNKKP